MSEQSNIPEDKISVEVAYALPKRQKIIPLNVARGTTAKQAVTLSNIENFFPDIDIDNAHFGLFGQSLGTKGLATADKYVLEPGDRIEIYRPLISDPKEVRKRRAEKAKNEKANAATPEADKK